ncbi:MAG: rod shape-determining protein MreC [Lactobacillales bacterium]|jgi:rod shape-determining protein MreC|nr:rod shape-determining protein MreC [Lactobacillales bacterium]
MENNSFRFKRMKAQIRQFAPVLFLLVALLILAFVTSSNPFVIRAKSVLVDGTAPVVSVLEAPIRWVQSGVRSIGDMILVYQENEKLRQENKELYKWRSIALQLAYDNKELSKLLNHAPPKSEHTVTARVLADPGEVFSKSKIVAAGRNQNVKKGSGVFTDKGMIGRVAEVGASYSRILLLTDYLSRVPVLVGESRIPCIMTGDNSLFPKLTLLPEGAQPLEGDVVISSGDAGVFPPGLPIGVVSKTDEDEIAVSLVEDAPVFEFVQIVDFGLGESIIAPPPCADRAE